MAFNKSQEAITVKISQKVQPELDDEQRPKTPTPLEYGNHPGHDGPMLRDGKLRVSISWSVLTSKVTLADTM